MTGIKILIKLQYESLWVMSLRNNWYACHFQANIRVFWRGGGGLSQNVDFVETSLTSRPNLIFVRIQQPTMLYRTKKCLCKIWGFHGGDYIKSRLLGCGAMWVYWNRRFGGTCCLHLQGRSNASEGKYSKVTRSSETSVHNKHTGATSQKTAFLKKTIFLSPATLSRSVVHEWGCAISELILSYFSIYFPFNMTWTAE
jgi:hypothetical protein